MPLVPSRVPLVPSPAPLVASPTPLVPSRVPLVALRVPLVPAREAIVPSQTAIVARQAPLGPFQTPIGPFQTLLAAFWMPLVPGYHFSGGPPPASRRRLAALGPASPGRVVCQQTDPQSARRHRVRWPPPVPAAPWSQPTQATQRRQYGIIRTFRRGLLETQFQRGYQYVQRIIRATPQSQFVIRLSYLAN